MCEFEVDTLDLSDRDTRACVSRDVMSSGRGGERDAESVCVHTVRSSSLLEEGKHFDTSCLVKQSGTGPVPSLGTRQPACVRDWSPVTACAYARHEFTKGNIRPFHRSDT